MKKSIKFVLLGISTVISAQVLAADYPFNLPNSVNATININTSQQEKFNNLLLGTNIHHFSSAKEKEFVKMYDPITVRFPHGLWANWYDWRTDQTRLFGKEKFNYTFQNKSQKEQEVGMLSNIRQFEKSKQKIGIDGLEQLNYDKKRANNGKGFDMMWTFNMSADGPNLNNSSPETIARYDDLKSRGFEVKAIELGNENFYPGQRSSYIPNAEDYIKRAKSMAKALKKKDPNIQVSVPLLRRNSFVNPTWNKDLTKDTSYFDAVTVHTYVGSNPDDRNSGPGPYGTALTARYHMAKSITDYAQKVAPSKPIWLTEWGVKSGGANAVSALGMADVYIFMSQNQDVYDRANWFSTNGKLNSFVVWEDYKAPSGATRSRIKYPLRKTAFGATYEIVRDVFEDSSMLNSWMTSPDLMKGVDAVSARAVVKDGKTSVFVLNLTDKAVPFTVKLDGTVFNGNFKHRAMVFPAMNTETTLPINTDPLKTIKQGSGKITLPKFSISRIELSNTYVKPTEFSVEMTAPQDNSEFKLGETVKLTANIQSNGSNVRQVNLLVNGKFFKRVNTAPYTANWTPTEAGNYSIHAIAIKTDGTRIPASSRSVIVSETGNTNLGNTVPSGKCLNCSGNSKFEVDLSNTNCVNFPINLRGKTFSVWDSDKNTQCDFRGVIKSLNGNGSLSVTKNYATTKTISGTKIEFSGSCSYAQIRVY